MSDWLKVWTADEVQNQNNTLEKSKAYASYLQQRLGLPFPTLKDQAILRSKAKAIFDQYPEADWKTLCKVADYCKARKQRPPRAWMVIDLYREAWAAGFAPELGFNYVPPAPEVDSELAEILQHEHRSGWRRRLLMAQGPQAKREVLAEWKNDPVSSPSL